MNCIEDRRMDHATNNPVGVEKSENPTHVKLGDRTTTPAEATIQLRISIRSIVTHGRFDAIGHGTLG